jgi:CRISPR-associated endonuclease/helicase Cas3
MVLAMDQAPRHEECWAKTTEDGQPGISVRDHCLNVGCVAEALLASALVPPPPGTATMAALHDVGKVLAGFQSKSEPWLVAHALRDLALREAWNLCESDHAKVSQFTVQQLLANWRLDPWAAAVGAHHGRIKGRRVKLRDAVPNREAWESERKRLAEELIAEFGSLPGNPPAQDEALVWYVAGLITVADWIGSDERRFPQDARWDMAERRRKARAALEAIKWKRPTMRRLNGFAELFPATPEANDLQAAVMRSVREPGVYVREKEKKDRHCRLDAHPPGR